MRKALSEVSARFRSAVSGYRNAIGTEDVACLKRMLKTALVIDCSSLLISAVARKMLVASTNTSQSDHLEGDLTPHIVITLAMVSVSSVVTSWAAITSLSKLKNNPRAAEIFSVSNFFLKLKKIPYQINHFAYNWLDPSELRLYKSLLTYALVGNILYSFDHHPSSEAFLATLCLLQNLDYQQILHKLDQIDLTSIPINLLTDVKALIQKSLTTGRFHLTAYSYQLIKHILRACVDADSVDARPSLTTFSKKSLQTVFWLLCLSSKEIINKSSTLLLSDFSKNYFHAFILVTSYIVIAAFIYRNKENVTYRKFRLESMRRQQCYLEFGLYGRGFTPIEIDTSNEERFTKIKQNMRAMGIQMSDTETEAYYDVSCPVSHCLFDDPIKLADGRHYEREAIIRWYQHSDRCPFNRSEFITQDHSALPVDIEILGKLKTFLEGLEQRVEEARISSQTAPPTLS